MMSGDATVTCVDPNLVRSFAEVAVILTISAVELGFGFGATYETVWPLRDVTGAICPHGDTEQEIVQLTPLESLITVALRDALAPPSMVCGDGAETLTEIGALLLQPASTMAKSTGRMQGGPEGSRNIEPPESDKPKSLKK